MQKAFVHLTAAVIGTLALGQVTNASAATSFEQLVEDSKAEMAETGGVVRIALDWPESDAKPVFQALMKEFPFMKVEYKRESDLGRFERFFIAIQQGQFPPYELFDVPSAFEKQYWEAGIFVKPNYDYKLLDDSLPAGWPRIHPASMDPEGRYLATVAQTRGIAWNPTLVTEADAPKTFADCADPKWKGKTVLDGRNKTQALLFDPKTSEATAKILREMKANGTVVANGEQEALTRLASGEFAIACYVNYHTAQQMIDEGEKNLRFTLADVVPVELAARLGVPKWSKAPETAQLITLWLATKGQPIIDKSAYRGFPWAEGSSLFELAKGKDFVVCSAECFAKYEELNKQYAELLGIPYIREFSIPKPKE